MPHYFAGPIVFGCSLARFAIQTRCGRLYAVVRELVRSPNPFVVTIPALKHLSKICNHVSLSSPERIVPVADPS